MGLIETRRGFLGGIAASATAGLFSAPSPVAADEPLETITVRIGKNRGVCLAPQYIAEELLHAEGFTDVRYVDTTQADGTLAPPVGRGETDFSAAFAIDAIQTSDTGAPVVVCSPAFM
jgi:NitT/TauT family transport system substrate-binding protein